MPPSLPPDRYQDCGPFARGGTAAVHHAVDQHLDRPVAAKIATSTDPADLARFLREAKLTARLEHPNIVPVHDVGADWFTMKRIQGITLSQMVRGEPYGVPMLGKVIDVLLKVCDALGYAHHRNIVHRDLKPENIMIGGFGQVYLMDWGIAVIDGETDAPWAGTGGWLAPEQARGDAVDGRTDVWGMGGLLYYALCGAKPNQGMTAVERQTRGPVRPPGEITPDRALPPELVRIAMKALEIDPGRRYPTIVAMAGDLHAARAGGWWFEQRAFPADTEIVREGEAAETAYILVEGRCEIRQNGGPIAEIEPGEIFGEAALLAGGVRIASVVALTEVVVRVLTRETLEAELARGGWMGPLVRGLAARFHELSADNLVHKRRL